MSTKQIPLPHEMLALVRANIDDPDMWESIFSSILLGVEQSVSNLSDRSQSLMLLCNVVSNSVRPELVAIVRKALLATFQKHPAIVHVASFDFPGEQKAVKDE